MNLRRTAAIVVRQGYLLRTSATRVLPLFIWVAIDMLLWGFMSRYLTSVSKLDFVPALLGAVIFWDFMIRVLQGVTMVFFEDVWSRNFLNIFGSPLSTAEYVTGLVVTSTITSLIGLIVMFVMAAAIFDLNVLRYGALLIPFLLVLFLFGIALGIFGSAMVLRWGPPAEWFVWPIPAILSPFVGVFYPDDTLPSWMQAIAAALPPSYVFESVRGIVSGHAASWSTLAAAGVLAFAYVALSCLYFQLTYKHAVRTGLIARYSAETLS